MAWLVQQVRELAQLQARRLEQVEALVESVLARPIRRFSSLRAAAASAVTFCLLGGITAACGETSSDSAYGSSSESVDAGSTGDATDATVLRDVDIPRCGPAERDEQGAAVEARLAERVPCYSGWVALLQSGEISTGLWGWADTNGWGLSTCETTVPQSLQLARELEMAAVAALENESLDCIFSHLVLGGVSEDVGRMEARIEEACGDDALADVDSHEYRIVVDASGQVSDVHWAGDNPTDEQRQTMDCIQAALDGLSFSCLAGFDVCPEFLIAE